MANQAIGPLRTVFDIVPYTDAGSFACPPVPPEGPASYFQAQAGVSMMGVMTMLYPDRCLDGQEVELLYAACVDDGMKLGLLVVDERNIALDFYERALMGPSVTQSYVDSWVTGQQPPPGRRVLPAMALYGPHYDADSVITKECMHKGYLVQHLPKTPGDMIDYLKVVGSTYGEFVIDERPLLSSDKQDFAKLLRMGYVPALTKTQADGIRMCIPRTAFNTGVDWSLCLLAAGFSRAGFERHMVLLEPTFVQSVRYAHLLHMAGQKAMHDKGFIPLHGVTVTPPPPTPVPMLDAGEPILPATGEMLIEDLLSDDAEKTLTSVMLSLEATY